MKTNQIFRRALSLLLCLCMVLSMGMTAFAEEGIDAQAAASPFESTKTLNDGSDADPETYTIDIDAIVNGSVVTEKTGVPLDVSIIFDRSDSMSFPADKNEVMKFSTYAQVEAFLNTLDPNQLWDGYYRVLNVGQGAVFYTSTDTTAEKYMTWESLRYNKSKSRWEVFSTTYNNSTTDGTRYAEGPHGILPNTTHVFSGYYGEWIDMKTAFNRFNSRKSYVTGCKNEVFSIAVPRLTKAQIALTDFITNLNEKANNLPDGEYHTVSITSYGGTVFRDGYKFPLKTNPDTETNVNYYNKAYKNNYGLGEKYEMNCSYSSIALAGTGTRPTAAQTDTLNYFIDEIVRNEYIYGTTYTDCAISDLLVNGALPAKDPERSRAVVLLTDGTPTGGMWYGPKVGNSAIKAAKTIKDDGATFYTLSFIQGLDPSAGYDPSVLDATTHLPVYDGVNDDIKAQNFLHLVSSNYPQATSMYDTGANVANDCFLADDGHGEQLLEHFVTILGKITTDVVTPLAGEKDSVSIYDEITREFMLDADKKVKVYVQEYLGNGSFGGKKYIGEHSLTTDKDSVITATNNAYKLYWDYEINKDDPAQPNVDLDISSIRLNWLDAKNGTLREENVENEGCYPDYTKGYKIGIEIPIEVNRENTLGGNNIPTNTDASGLYKSTTDDTTNQPDFSKEEIEYEIPNANVEAKFETEVFDYFMDLEDLVANQNAGVDTAFAEAIFAAMLEDPDALLDYLKNNKNDYVNLEIDLETMSAQELYGLIANAAADAFAPTGAESEVTFDFAVDQILSALANLTYTSYEIDSIGVAPFQPQSQSLAPNYYGPKYVVVDFDETVKTPLDKEGGLNPAVTTDNGAIEGSNICYNFRSNYASGDKSYLEKNYTTVGYQVEAINAPKAQKGNKIVDRKFYVIPANVMTYDDTFMDVDANGWETIGRYEEGNQSHNNSVIHGYDDLYNKTYSKDYYHNALMAVTVSKTKGVAQATFTINGTGFDIFAQTGPNSGTLAVEVSTDEYYTKDVRSYLVDTYLKEATLNQIPVVRCDDLPYGTYYIRITAFYDSIFDHNYVSQWKKGAALTEEALRERYGIPADADFTFIPSQSGYDRAATRAINAATNGQYNVYIDGFRVYNTIENVYDKENKETYNAIANYGYNVAGEGFANLLNINDNLIDADSEVSWGGNEVSGILYTAALASKENPEEGWIPDNANQGEDTPGIILGMEGRMYTKADETDKSKIYVFKDKECTDPVYYKNKENRVYYIAEQDLVSPNDREYKGLKYYYDGATTTEPMTTKEIKEAFGGEMPVYYNARYSQYGPEKEVYLNGDNGVAFRIDNGATKVMVSLKSHDGNTATLKIYDSKSTGSDKFVTLAATASRVEMYYDITKYITSDGYIYLKNAGGITAVCNIKTIGTATRGISVDRDLMAWVQAINYELPVDGDAEIKHSLDLASDISLNYAVSKATLADYDEVYLEVNFKGETFFLEPEINGDYGYFTVDGITAVDMTEELAAKLHMFLGEEEFVSETDVYSVATYAYAQLKKSNASEELKAVCANLLRYGALAQAYKGNENAPADAEMTAEEKAYLTDLNTVSVINTGKVLNDVENGIAWAGKALVLDSKVAVKAIFDLTGYAGDIEALNLRVSYVNAKGEEVTLTVSNAEVYNAEKNFYAFTVDTLLATEMRSELTMALYEGETQISMTQVYSVESYCAKRTGALAELGKSLLAYSDAAKAYFN